MHINLYSYVGIKKNRTIALHLAKYKNYWNSMDIFPLRQKYIRWNLITSKFIVVSIYTG